MNPARSGDTKLIYWMVKTKIDFYYEDYRSVAGYCEIIKKALGEHGDELREAAKNPTNQWLRNVKTYIGV